MSAVELSGAYLGDGAYVRVGQGDVEVWTEREGVRHWVALGPDELKALGVFLANVAPALALSIAREMKSTAERQQDRVPTEPPAEGSAEG